MITLDIFSGAATDLIREHRTAENVLLVLTKYPLISTFDMEEHAWLRGCIDDLKRNELITRDDVEPYPWIRYVVTRKSKATRESE